MVDVLFSVSPLNGVISSRRPTVTNTVLFNTMAWPPRLWGKEGGGCTRALGKPREGCPPRPAGKAAWGQRQACWGGAAAELEHRCAVGTPVPDGRLDWPSRPSCGLDASLRCLQELARQTGAEEAQAQFKGRERMEDMTFLSLRLEPRLSL